MIWWAEWTSTNKRMHEGAKSFEIRVTGITPCGWGDISSLTCYTLMHCLAIWALVQVVVLKPPKWHLYATLQDLCSLSDMLATLQPARYVRTNHWVSQRLIPWGPGSFTCPTQTSAASSQSPFLFLKWLTKHHLCTKAGGGRRAPQNQGLKDHMLLWYSKL